jgi:hypothetical protein
MNIAVIVATVNELSNISSILRHEMIAHSCDLIVIDEGHARIRDRNMNLLKDVNAEFFGPQERADWFKKRFKDWRKFMRVIPNRCHAETSFGFLVALEHDADIVVEIDDDVFPLEQEPLLTGHLKNLSDSEGLRVDSPSKWYNTLHNLILETQSTLWPRGHPYSLDARSMIPYTLVPDAGKSVLNMGLWTGDPDLDARTLLEMGGLDGKSKTKSEGLRHRRLLVQKGTYFAICSMNTAFRAEIIPAFYQLYMKQLGIDRFDDIWSGLFIKKIADHLGDRVALGAPLVFHDKRPRDVRRDVDAERHGVAINETLWRIIDSMELDGKGYYECFQSLANGLGKSLNVFREKLHQDFMRLQVEKQQLWLTVIDKIE